MTVEFISLPSLFHIDETASRALPRHHLGDVDMLTFHLHPNVRENVIGYGAFVFDSLIFNQEVNLVANEEYWRGRPQLDSVTFYILTPEEAFSRLLEGTIDVAEYIRDSDADVLQANPNIHVMGTMNNDPNMYYFMLGSNEFEEIDGVDTVNWIPRTDNHPVTNPEVRRAIAYAMDEATIAATLGSRVNVLANSFLAPFYHRHLIPDSPGLSLFNLELANQILDEAGFPMGAHGFRQDAGGNPIVVHIAMLAGTEFIFETHRQNLAQIGIDLRLTGDTFYGVDQITAMFTGDRVVLDPLDPVERVAPRPLYDMVHFRSTRTYNPIEFWNPRTLRNVRDLSGRFLNDEMEALIAEFDNIRDLAHMDELLLRWDTLFNTYVPAIPSYWTMNFSAVNTRVTGITAPPDTSEFWRNLANIGLTR